MKTRFGLFEDFSRETSVVIRNYSEWTADKIVSELDRIESDFLAKAGSSKCMIAEVRRRVAERKLDLLALKNESIDVVEKFYMQNYVLGFSNINRRATVDIFFAQYCMRASEFRRARLILKTLIRIVESSKTAKRRRSYDDILHDANGNLRLIPF